MPRPGETAEEMFRVTGWAPESPEDGGPVATFHHDVPAALAEEALARGRRQSSRPGTEPWPLPAWPAVPTRAVIGRRARFLPASWLRAVTRDRPGIEPHEIDSAHCPALSRPAELASLLHGFAGHHTGD